MYLVSPIRGKNHGKFSFKVLVIVLVVMLGLTNLIFIEPGSHSKASRGNGRGSRTWGFTLNSTGLPSSGDYNFIAVGDVDGDFNIKGPGYGFVYQSVMTSTFHPNAKFFFDHKTTLTYDTGSEDKISMIDGSSQLCFDESVLYAKHYLRLTKGKLRFDNKVTFSAVGIETIYFGDGNPTNNLGLEFGKGSKLVYVGNLVNSNA